VCKKLAIGRVLYGPELRFATMIKVMVEIVCFERRRGPTPVTAAERPERANGRKQRHKTLLTFSLCRKLLMQGAVLGT
jgi:hypothetical protein